MTELWQHNNPENIWCYCPLKLGFFCRSCIRKKTEAKKDMTRTAINVEDLRDLEEKEHCVICGGHKTDNESMWRISKNRGHESGCWLRSALDKNPKPDRRAEGRDRRGTDIGNL